MSATGRTPFYNLATYREYDITSYLMDFNGNMEAIDTALKTISDTITGGGGAIGAASDAYRYFPNANTTVRNNVSGSKTQLITIPNIQPNVYNMSGFVLVDPSQLPDNGYAEVSITAAGKPTTFSFKIYKEEKERMCSFAVPITVIQKDYVTLDATLQSSENSAVTFKAVALTIQKLNV